MKNRVKFFLIMALFMLLLPLAALADSLTEFYVQPSEYQEKAAQAVNWYKRSSREYDLYLPAGMKCESLRIFFSGAEEIKIGDETLRCGDITSLLQPGAKLKVVWGKEKVTLNVMQSANIHAIFITTETGSMEKIHENKEYREKGHLTLLDPEGTAVIDLPLDEIKGRGNATFQYKKKPYQIKFDEKVDFLGMGKSKKWILLANYIDYSLIRNRIAFDMGLAVGMEWTCRSEFVDLYLNHDYAGNYLLTEKVEIGDNRIDIRDLEGETEDVNDEDLDSYGRSGNVSYKKNTRKYWNIPNDPEDITGGYLLELELTNRYVNEASGIVTKRGQPVVIKEPEYASKAQVDYIGDLLQAFEDAIFADDGINPQTGKHYSEYIDKDSYVTKFLIEEILKNYDSNRTSQYFYKPADEESTLLYAAPIWDFDQSLDNYGAKGSKVFLTSNKSTGYHWFPQAYEIPDFRQRLEEIYHERFVPALEVLIGTRESDGVLRSVRSYADEIAASAQMNFRRWGYTKADERYTHTGKNFEQCVDYIQKFLENRLDICNERWKMD